LSGITASLLVFATRLARSLLDRAALVANWKLARMTASDHAASAILGLCVGFALALGVYAIKTAPPMGHIDWYASAYLV
jgi:hypothetical protein